MNRRITFISILILTMLAAAATVLAAVGPEEPQSARIVRPLSARVMQQEDDDQAQAVQARQRTQQHSDGGAPGDPFREQLTLQQRVQAILGTPATGDHNGLPDDNGNANDDDDNANDDDNGNANDDDNGNANDDNDNANDDNGGHDDDGGGHDDDDDNGIGDDQDSSSAKWGAVVA
jgi:hypothetical protein